MKKFIVGTIAAVLMASGLVATAGVTASAAPYPGTVRTNTTAAGVAPTASNQARVFVKVTSFNRGRPQEGRVEFTFVNRRTGESFSFTRGYDGPDTYTFWGLTPGRYRVVVNFIPTDDSKFKASSDTANARVRR